MDPNLTQQIINNAVAELSKSIQDGSANNGDNVRKAGIALGTQIYGYDLENQVKVLVPGLQSWARNIPRRIMPTGLQHEFRRITGITSRGPMTAAEGSRGNSNVFTSDLQQLALGNVSSGVTPITYQAEKAGGNFADPLAYAVTLGLLAGLRNECALIVGGNVTALGAVAGVTATENTSIAGTYTTPNTYYFFIRAMTMAAVQRAQLLSPRAILTPDASDRHTACVTSTGSGTSTKPYIDLTYGYGAPSTVASCACSGSASSVDLAWTAIPGAFGYAIFCATTNDITAARFQGVVCQNAVTLTSHSLSAGVMASASDTYVDGDGTTQTKDTTGDTSADANSYKGIVEQLCASGSGAYLKNLASKLSPANGVGIAEIDDLLTGVYYNQFQVDDVTLICGNETRKWINRAYGAGASTTVLRINVPNGSQEQRDLTAGGRVNNYLHPITGKPIPIVTDPNWHDGMIMAVPNSFPYPNTMVEAPTMVWLSYDWVSFQYAITKPTKQFENQCRGGVAVYAPTAYGLIYNVYAG